MKKLSSILLISFFLILNLSCSKKYCWICETTLKTYYSSGTPAPQTSTSKTTVCDKSEKQIKEVEKEGSTFSQGKAGNVTVTMTSTMHCAKQ